jgi:hypothetical protein
VEKARKKSNPIYNVKERRIFDIYGINTLAKAAEKSIIKKLDAKELSDIADKSSKLYNESDYILAPWRFAENGWRFIKKDQVNQYLNHPNKLNSVGF